VKFQVVLREDPLEHESERLRRVQAHDTSQRV
jgi:hypothetical protein